ncbi:CPBP family intramembrane glutamic endopeptidase [Rubripirellula reticaptiva]|uniref:CAAX amino terminal protease self-immunity n=1 Tax=Rubripirellula reticaptiva TaxID=2528013 RepID=A0A5C6EZH9_9BACT|nr:CPBP family intramembrane glutamic endopeptidase [Rubripirellula reticaptiva]TWU55073.1 CAAX amino terminal protease self- immunity [Rubripirellula reticaptiva]
MNPYHATDEHAGEFEEPILATLVNPLPDNHPDGSPVRPRWWTTLVVIAASGAAFLFASTVLALAAVWIVYGEVSFEILGSAATMATLFESRWGLLLLFVMPQFALVAVPLAAARLSPEPMTRRLGLVRGTWPTWAWIGSALATPLVGLVSGILVGLFLEESDGLKEMSGVFRIHGQNGFLVPLALMIGATPAICEEILFRGYIQTRLVRSFSPLVGGFVASFLFAAFHMDLVHVVAVFPMGVFLGIVSYRSGSLFPAMLGHFVNNVISVVMIVMSPEDETDVLAAPAIAVTLSILVVGILGMAATVAAAVMYGPPGIGDSVALGATPLPNSSSDGDR